MKKMKTSFEMLFALPRPPPVPRGSSTAGASTFEYSWRAATLTWDPKIGSAEPKLGPEVPLEKKQFHLSFDILFAPGTLPLRLFRPLAAAAS